MQRMIVMKKQLITVLLILGGASVFVFGNPYYSIFPTNKNQTYYIILTIFYFAISVFFKKSKSLAIYWTSAFSLFVASSALLFLSTGVFNIHSNTIRPIKNLALDKFSQLPPHCTGHYFVDLVFQTGSENHLP